MAGFTIHTGVGADTALKTARKIAKKLGFATHPVDDWEFTAMKGNLLASIFLGAFIAYCDFRVCIEEGRNGSMEISIERNTPWWTGVIGVNRVKNQAKALADAIEEAILDQGGDVLKRTEF